MKAFCFSSWGDVFSPPGPAVGDDVFGVGRVVLVPDPVHVVDFEVAAGFQHLIGAMGVGVPIW